MRPCMPIGLRKFQKISQLHFITFICYLRQPKLGTNIFEQSLGRTQRAYGSCVAGYAVMPGCPP